MGKKAGSTLNDRERAFVDAYLGSCAGNATKAARAAGYAKTTSEKQASRLLGKVGIRAAIAARQQRVTRRSILTAEERDELLSAIADDETHDVHARISAIKELNKCTGRHSIRHQLGATETLADIIAGSRA